MPTGSRRSVGEAAAEWRPPTRLMCLCSKRWEDPTAISGRTFISVGRSSQAELRFKWSSVVFFFFPSPSFFLSEYRSIPRCWDNNIMQAELHPQEYFSLPSQVVCFMFLLCVWFREAPVETTEEICFVQCDVGHEPWSKRVKPSAELSSTKPRESSGRRRRKGST